MSERTPDLNVVFLSSTFVVGGAERHLSVLVPMLRDRGIEPAVVALRSTGPFFDELAGRGIWARFLPVRSRFDLIGMRRAVREIGSWPKVVVSQGLDTQIVGQLIAWRTGAVHVTIHHKQPELPLAPHRRWLTRLVARWIDHAVAVSSAQIPDLLSLGFRRDRIDVIENGVLEPRTTRSRGEVRAELGLEDTDFVALLAATLRPEKRAGVFVDGVADAHRLEPRIRGVVAGGGPELDAVRQQAGAESGVTAVGMRSDVPNLMLAADVVCLTSSAEALPMVILEAMALGKAVIATDVGGVSDVVADGESGIVTRIDDGEDLTRSLLALGADPAAVSAMGAAARNRYETRYSAELMADRYAAMLRGAAGPTTS